jgi:hypothetical protein
VGLSMSWTFRDAPRPRPPPRTINLDGDRNGVVDEGHRGAIDLGHGEVRDRLGAAQGDGEDGDVLGLKRRTAAAWAHPRSGRREDHDAGHGSSPRRGPGPGPAPRRCWCGARADCRVRRPGRP